jgi:NTE family protein
MTHKKTISLALQGGGSHGAFTWGVLDEILADERLTIEAISGTSAGSMNAAIAAYGIEQGGNGKARALLEQFWSKVAQAGALSPIQPSLLDRMTGNHNLEYSPAFWGMDMLSRMMSPYQFNPMGFNPLRDILTGLIDFEALRHCNKIKLYVSATNVKTCGLKVFHGAEISVDALLASACLPFMFKAVEIDGHSYWDGGYMGNPTLYPLIHKCAAHDLVIVQINPIFRTDVPKTSSAILDRINEISFNASLLHELRGLQIINKLLRDNHIDAEKSGLRHLHLHLVHDDRMMRDLSYASKMNADYDFLFELCDAGKAAARRWLDRHYDKIGSEGSLDLTELAA